MQQIQQIVISGALSIITILVGIAVQAVKQYLITKGGENAVKLVEIVAKNAVNAVEQIAADKDLHGEDKLVRAKAIIVKTLNRNNIQLTESQLEMFIESAVKQMNDSWRGD